MADGDSSDFTFCKVGVVVVCVSAFMFAVLLLCTITLLISFFPCSQKFSAQSSTAYFVGFIKSFVNMKTSLSSNTIDNMSDICFHTKINNLKA